MGLGLAEAVKTLVVFWALLGWILTIRVMVENRPGSNRRHTKSDCRKTQCGTCKSQGPAGNPGAPYQPCG